MEGTSGCIEANSNEFLDRPFLRADDNVSDVLSAKTSGVMVKAEKTELLTLGKKSNACREAAIGKTSEVLKAC